MKGAALGINYCVKAYVAEMKRAYTQAIQRRRRPSERGATEPVDRMEALAAIRARVQNENLIKHLLATEGYCRQNCTRLPRLAILGQGQFVVDCTRPFFTSIRFTIPSAKIQG